MGAKVGAIAMAIVTIAGITTVVTHGGQSADVVRAIGRAFAGSLMAAQGKG
jgi:hypothetical protein